MTALTASMTRPRHRAQDEQPVPFVLDADTMTAAAQQQWMPLIRLGVLLVHDRAVAEDVVQSAFEGAWRRQPKVTSFEQLTAYLRTSVVNGCRSVGRRRGTAARHPVRCVPGPA